MDLRSLQKPLKERYRNDPRLSDVSPLHGQRRADSG